MMKLPQFDEININIDFYNKDYDSSICKYDVIDILDTHKEAFKVDKVSHPFNEYIVYSSFVGADRNTWVYDSAILYTTVFKSIQKIEVEPFIKSFDPILKWIERDIIEYFKMIGKKVYLNPMIDIYSDIPFDEKCDKELYAITDFRDIYKLLYNYRDGFKSNRIGWDWCK